MSCVPSEILRHKQQSFRLISQ